MGSYPSRFTMPPFAVSIIMSFEDQKRFERFTHLGPPRFSDVVEKDAYEFLIDFGERFYNFILLELHGIAYTTY